jgi:hypothetical protein
MWFFLIKITVQSPVHILWIIEYLNRFLWQISSQFFDYSWRLWQSDVQTLLHGFSALSQNYNSNADDQHHELYLTCERWLLCSKIIRQLIISGFQSDSKCFQVIIFFSCFHSLLWLWFLFLEDFITFLLLDFQVIRYKFMMMTWHCYFVGSSASQGSLTCSLKCHSIISSILWDFYFLCIYGYPCV